MSDRIEFTRNYSDLSTDRGFQFEFFCDHCGNGVRTEFKTSTTGLVSEALDTAGGVLGGILGRAAEIGDRVHSAAWQKARDHAFQEAVKEIMPEFFQCPRCNSWVCRERCVNEKRGLCNGCAPDLGVEMSAAQASRSVEEVWAHAAMAGEDKHLGKETWRETIRAACPKCEHPLETDAKFCPNCGAKLRAAEQCAKCGAKLTPDAKFCAECGEKVEL